MNNTVLFVMGDHGNRIGYVMYTYVGRIEERMTYFSVYFPEWFRRKYPEAMRRLEINKHRLTSNYDVYRMIREIINGTIDKKTDPPIDPKMAVAKGISLFRPIPVDRNCSDANIPPPHCVCLEPVPSWNPTSKINANDTLYQLSKDLIYNWTRLQLEIDPKCRRVDDLEILSLKTLTTSQMIQHGVRDLSPDQTKKLQRRIDGDIEYVDMIYRMVPINVTARARLQYYKRPKKSLIVNVPPHPYSKIVGGRWESKLTINGEVNDCSTGNRTTLIDQEIPWFCQCQPK